MKSLDAKMTFNLFFLPLSRELHMVYFEPPSPFNLRPSNWLKQWTYGRINLWIRAAKLNKSRLNSGGVLKLTNHGGKSERSSAAADLGARFRPFSPNHRSDPVPPFFLRSSAAIRWKYEFIIPAVDLESSGSPAASYFRSTYW